MKYEEMVSGRGPIMLSYLKEKLYRVSSRMIELLDSIGLELDGVWHTVDDILDQCFIERATWGLHIWEEEFGLSPEPTDNYEIRRVRIKAKIIGFGSFTEAVAQELANNYSRSGNALFVPMYDQYSFTTQYEDDDLISYAGLRSAFADAKPAHLLHLIGMLLTVNFPFDVIARAKIKMDALVELQSISTTSFFINVYSAIELTPESIARFILKSQAPVYFPPLHNTRTQITLVDSYTPVKIVSQSKYKMSSWMLAFGQYDNINPDVLVFNGWYLDGSQYFNGINSQGLKIYYEMSIPCAIRHIRDGQIIESEE